MSYQVMAFTTSPFTQQRIYQLLCDTPEDLPASAVSGDYPGNLSQGCTAKVISNSADYMYNSAGSWIRQAGNNVFENVYTKTEVDDLIAAAMSTVITKADIYRGWQLVSSAAEPLDINSVTDYGTYYCSDGATAATIQNCPITTSGFIMINFSNGNRVRLFLAISATIPRMFIQARTGGTWRTIRQFAMNDEIPSSVPISLLSQIWENGTATDATGNFDAPSSARIRSQHYFSIPDDVTAFQVSANYQSGLSVGHLRFAPYFYDVNKIYLGDIEGTGWYGWTDSGLYRSIPTNAKFVRLVLRYADGSAISPTSLISGNISYT